ncbi:MAG: GAF domain-containing protein [Deltaproteobacteria bacterium]|nr:GAF domain-containing protein [Deltaproteobacteria bacterium]
MSEQLTVKQLTERVRALEEQIARREESERTLQESKAWLSQVLQEIPIPTFVIDREHRVTHINKSFETLTGISAKDILGTRNQWKAFYPTERPTMADLILDNASEGDIARYYKGGYQKSALLEGGYQSERLFRHLRDGSRWLFFTASPLKDASGKLIGAIETLQDITEQKKAELALKKSERRMRTLLDFVPYPIVVFTLTGRVYYLNPAFTETFGWTLDELEGKTIPYTPPGLEEETGKAIRELLEKKVILRHETKRLTKDGRILDVVMRAVVYSEDKNEPAGELVLLRDITREKKIARMNQTILRFSTSLHEYPEMENLLDYISAEIKQLLDAEGGLVVLLDEENQELYYKGAAFDDNITQERIKEIRFPADRSVAGKVIRTGEPIVVPDTSMEPDFFPGVDKKLGYHTRNILEVPLKSGDRIIGALCARNKKDGNFDETDLELLNMMAGTVALAIENARFSKEIIEAYRTNEALLRISRALPEYPELEPLQDYISQEVKRLLDSEGALVILLDDEKQELYFIGAAYDDTATEKRIKEIRFPLDELVAGKVIRTGKPLIVSDTATDRKLHSERDKKLGYHTRNLLLVPLKSKDRIIGVLCAINKKGDEPFDQANVELLSMIAGTVALSIDNARFAEELKRAYIEVSSMNRAKDKVINHLSHELKTPVSVLSGSLSILEKHLKQLPTDKWKNTIARSKKNLERIIEIQGQVEDIMRERQYRSHGVLTQLLRECADELETLIAEEVGENAVVETVRKKIDDLFGPKKLEPKESALDRTVNQRIEALEPLFSHRQVHIERRLEPAPSVCMPLDPLHKIIDGLIKNAIENTPDEGKIEITVRQRDGGAELVVRDYGVGIIEEDQRRIFDGFFATQDTMAYSSKRAFDFNAGGKGADLLRMKIFSERYGFEIQMESTRCQYIPTSTDVCPGRISECAYCKTREDCFQSGGSAFTVYFPAKGEAESLSASHNAWIRQLSDRAVEEKAS